jgi:protease I
MSARLPALIVIAPKGFQDHELAGTLEGLATQSLPYVLSSKHEGRCEGKFGSAAEATLALHAVDPAAFVGVVFIGGPGAHALKTDSDALRVAKEFAALHKPVGAICVAPTILAAAGVLKGKRATAWPDEAEYDVRFLEEYGVKYTGEEVTVDGNVVTAIGPSAALSFGKTMAEMFAHAM